MRRHTLLLSLAAFISANALSASTHGGWEWETLETVGEPLARHEAAFVEFEGEFYLMGGRRIQPVSIYNPETNTWRNASRPPIEFHHFQPVLYKDRILIIGAMTGRFPTETPISRVLEYYPRSDTWKWGHSIPIDRRRGSAGVVNIEGLIYVTCGIIRGHMGGFVNWFDVYNPQTGEWEVLPDAPHKRDHFQSTYLDGKLYNAGGRRTSRETNEVVSLLVPQVDVYDFTSGAWSTLPEDLPTPRAGNSTATIGADIVVAGGETGHQRTAHNEVEAWDTLMMQWIDYPSLQRGRHGTSLIVFGDYIYTCSGSGNRGGSPELTSTERLPLPELDCCAR